MSSLATLDWIVVAVYGAAVVAIGVVVNRRQKDSEDYFLGGRRMAWWVVGVSLVATSFSSISLIGGTGFGYARGMQWLQLQIGDLVAILLVCAIFLPFFSGLRITTAYEYLEKRFGPAIRTVAAGLFVGQILLRASILVLSPALALSAVTGLDTETAIYIAAGAAIAYSAFGGIGAVVWTDLVQLSVVVFALGFCLVLVVGDVPGGMGAILDHARESGHLEVVTPEVDPGTPFNLLGALVPYMVLAFSLFGTSQPAVQRFLSVKDLASARRAALTGWAVGTLALGFTLFVGVCIAGWQALAPSAAGFAPAAADKVLPAFLAARVPAGIAGLLLAAIFAASMSSLDSAIHSMSTVCIVDFRRRFFPLRSSPRVELLTARTATVACGLLAVIGAGAVNDPEARILETLVTWLGYFAGPLLGIFLLGMLSRRANERGTLIGLGIGAGAVLALVAIVGAKHLGFHPLWLAPISFATTYASGWIASLLFPAPPPGKLAGLALGAPTPPPPPTAP